VDFSGIKLEELADRTGIERRELKKMLEMMAEKVTMWIDPGSEDPNYRTLTIEGPGIAETVAWGASFRGPGSSKNAGTNT